MSVRRCDVCNELRDFDDLKIMKADISHQYNLAKGTMVQNHAYCENNEKCHKGALEWQADMKVLKPEIDR